MVTSKSCTVHAKIILVQPVIARRWVVEFSVADRGVVRVRLDVDVADRGVVRVRLDVVVRLRVQLDVDVEVELGRHVHVVRLHDNIVVVALDVQDVVDLAGVLLDVVDLRDVLDDGPNDVALRRDVDDEDFRVRADVDLRRRVDLDDGVLEVVREMLDALDLDRFLVRVSKRFAL